MLSRTIIPSLVLTFLFQVESHLQTQKAAVQMLHDRIVVLVKYLADVLAGILITSLSSSGSLIQLQIGRAHV